ncbi:MAG: response regulator, partial [Bdellovibrionales bacterium]|nr:response regulator [Bdellovibrionales bacterium]
MSEQLKWILVADDDADFLELVTVKLEMTLGSGLKIITAANGLEASSRLPYQAFDCIITDLKMPVKEGQALIKTVTQSALNGTTPIVVITGEPDRSLEKKYKQLKQFEKPADLDEVIKHVEQQIKLGPTDQRLTADLLNNFIKGVSEFIKETTQFESTLDVPYVKEENAAFQGDVFRVYDIRSGKSKARFLVGYPKTLLGSLDSKFNASSGDLKRLTGAAGKVIYDRLMKRGTGKGTTLSDSGYFDDPNDPGYEIERNRKGIVIPIKCQGDEKI